MSPALIAITMAQSKSFFGIRKGSTKSLTFSQFNGKQVTKDRVWEIKNPRSSAQMVQRMIIGTTARAYSALKPIADHSFAGYSYGLDNMRYFLRENARLIRQNVAEPTQEFAYNDFKTLGAVPGAYLISTGNLSSPNLLTAIKKDSGSKYGTTINFGPARMAVDQDNIGVTWQPTEVSGKAISDSLGIPEGGYITVVFLAGVGAAEGVYSDLQLGWMRIHYNGDTTIAPYTSSESNNDEAVEVFNSFKIEWGGIAQANYGGVKLTQFPTGSSGLAYAASAYVAALNYNGKSRQIACYAIIASQKVNEKWQRSTERMQLVPDIIMPTFNQAVATYPTGPGFILNGDNGVLTKEEFAAELVPFVAEEQVAVPLAEAEPQQVAAVQEVVTKTTTTTRTRKA